MKDSANTATTTRRSRWLLGASVPAVLLALGMTLNTAHAGEDDKDNEQSESRSTGEAISDGWITTKVRAQLLADREVSGFDISVETRDKVVYLSGEVEDQSQVSHAVEIAEETEGVEDVDATALRIATAVDQARDAVGMADD